MSDKNSYELDSDALDRIVGGASSGNSGSSGTWIDPEWCINCGACAECCPSGAIYSIGNAYAIDASSCIHCGGCVQDCPVDAITLG